MMLTVNKADLAALDQKLRELTQKLGRKAVRSAGRKAMKPVRDEVKRNAPRDPEDDGIHIQDSVGMTTKWRGNALYVRVGIKGGAKKNPKTPYYFRMVEFGTKDMPARPWMAPALDRNKQAVLDIFAAELKKALGL